MFLLMFLFAIRWPIRVKGIATVLFVAFFTFLFGLTAPEYMAVQLLFWSVAAMLLTRFGFVALIVFQFVRHVAEEFPLPADISTWYSGYALVPMAVIAALAIYGYLVALRRNPFPSMVS